MSGQSCQDEHGSHGHGHGHDHDHDHDHGSSSSGPAGNLYEQIDHPNVVALNAQAPAKICKPWNERLDDTIVSLS
jgi:hypothetical protein